MSRQFGFLHRKLRRTTYGELLENWPYPVCVCVMVVQIFILLYGTYMSYSLFGMYVIFYKFKNKI